MKSSFCLFILKLFFFLLLVFIVQRTIFIFFNYNFLLPDSGKEIFQAYRHGLRLDISTICYIFLFSLPLYIVWLIFPNKIVKVILSIYIITTLCLVVILTTIDSELYYAWGTRINEKVLFYLKYPKEVKASIAGMVSIINVLLILLQIAIYSLCYFLFISRKLKPEKQNLWFQISFPIVFFFLLVVGVRGGFQNHILKSTDCFYSKQSLLNYSTGNSLRNAVEKIFFHTESMGIDYTYYSEDEKQKNIKTLFSSNDNETEFICKTKRPNIVVIFMESVSAEAFGAYNNEYASVSPYFDKYATEGLLFTQFYATGFRTDQALNAVLTGFPGQPKEMINRDHNVFGKFPSIFAELKKANYYTSYYCSTDASFAETKPFLKSLGCDTIFERIHFEKENKVTEWGPYDEDLFEMVSKKMKNQQQPFFSLIFTVTNHESFGADVEKIYEPKSITERYLNTTHYTDKCIGDFIEASRKEDWFDNTLFIIVADHAHSLPKNRNSYEVNRHWIPMLFYGNVLKEQYRGKTINKIGSHSDFPNTILAQLELNTAPFTWGKNLFNQDQEGFAFYTFDEGFGLIEEKQAIAYDERLHDVIFVKVPLAFSKDTLILKQGKSLLQKQSEDIFFMRNF